MKKVSQVCVIGGGSAGFMTAVALKRRIPDLKVKLVRSGDIPIIGVGESTTFRFPAFMHDYLGIPMKDFLLGSKATWKLGLHFDWGSKERDHFYYAFGPNFTSKHEQLNRILSFYQWNEIATLTVETAMMEHKKAPFVQMADGSYRMVRGIGYHIENTTYVEFMEGVARKDGVEIIEGTITGFHREAGSGLVEKALLEDGREIEADLWVDASGFQGILAKKTMGTKFLSYSDNLLNDKAVVGGWDRDEQIRPYTGSQAMSSGWQFRVELPERINRGYIFSSQFISDEKATEEFIASNQGKVKNTRIVPFISGRLEKFWDGNVVAMGNAQGFVEPLESTALHMVCDAARYLVSFLLEGEMEIKPTLTEHFNRMMISEWEEVRWFLVSHFKYNEKHDTHFWQACKQLGLGPAQDIVDYYTENGPSDLAASTLLPARTVFGMEGWLAMLVGQKVPTKFRHTPTIHEEAYLIALRKFVADTVKAAPTNEEALAMIREDRYDWTQPYFN